MPVTYSIDASRRMIHTICSGALTFAEVIGHFRELSVDPACSGHLDVLLDLSDTSTLPERRQLGAVNAELDAIRRKVQFGLCAIVATRDALFGMMRMFEVLAGDYFQATRVFRAIDQAEAWLLSKQAGARSPN